MSPLALSGVIFACISGAAVLAMLVARALPDHHLKPESKDAVKQGLAVIATLVGFVLALLISAAKGSYDTNASTVRQLAADLLLLDRVLAVYGPETKSEREVVRRAATNTLDRIWPTDHAETADLTPGESRADMEAFYKRVAALEPKDDAQRALKARALDTVVTLTQTRIRLFAQRDSSIPVPFLVVLVLWLMILLAGCGLMAPRNVTVFTVILLCALSVSSALFLVLELDRPFEGVLRLSSAPLREAIAQLGK